MNAGRETQDFDTPDVVSVESVTHYWHGAAAAFGRALDPETAGLGRSAEEVRAWELHFRRIIGPSTRRVLDVGTGAGSLALLLAVLGYEVTAVDAVERMLEFTAAKADSTGLSIDLHHALADDLPFEPASFDVVTSKLVVWTLLEPERAVAEWMRVTVPGGLIVAIDGWNVPPRSALERARIYASNAGLRCRGGLPRLRRAQLPLGRSAPSRHTATSSFVRDSTACSSRSSAVSRS